MKKFLFEQYGYYPKEIVDNSFSIDGWRFKLLTVEVGEDIVSSINEYTKTLNEAFNNKGPYIIKNRLNNNISTLNNVNYILVCSLEGKMTLNDLIKFYSLFFNSEEFVELDRILEVWKNRVEEIEQKLNSYLRVDSIYYRNNLDIAVFCLGLAINAMQYLSDIIYNYDNKMYGCSIVHKRLTDFSVFDILNPFNFIVEHPLKDICMLYQKEVISFQEFKSFFNYYPLDEKSATFLMARLLYRADIFDCIENKRNLDEGEQQLNFNFEKEFYKIKKAYSFLKESAPSISASISAPQTAIGRRPTAVRTENLPPTSSGTTNVS